MSDHQQSSNIDSGQASSCQPDHNTRSLSRRKRMWRSFKKSTQRLRNRSKDRHGLDSVPSRAFNSNPDISRNKFDDEQEMKMSRRPGSFSVHFRNTFNSPDSGIHNLSTEAANGTASENDSMCKPGKADDGVAQSIEAVLQKKRRETALRQYSFFHLDIMLHKGHDLVVRDSCGTSDPYVKFKIGRRVVYKTKTVYRDLNPEWNESFTIPIDDVFRAIEVKVFDYDRGLQDDFMGSALLDLTTIEPSMPTSVKLNLSEPGKDLYMGFITLTVNLIPKTQEEKDQLRQSSHLTESSGKLKSQIWSSVITIVLVEGRNLLPMDANGLSDPYVKFRLGNEKFKSKVAFKTLNPRWLEQFDLHMYEDQEKTLEVTIWDKDVRTKDDFMGRCSIDVSQLQHEMTHNIWQDFEDGAGSVHILLTISGTVGTETISDLANYEPLPSERQITMKRYAIQRSFIRLRDIGHLTVKVFKAKNLAAADIGGKSDPFCVLELVNARLQTQTEYKTLAPEWNKIFTFNIKDIHSVLEVTVYDEDRNKSVEFLGKVAIPLLNIKNGERQWYALKDKKLMHRGKGEILLEMDVIYNPIKASVRTFNPKEEKYMSMDTKFKKKVFMTNVARVRNFALTFIHCGRFLQSCFQWESVPRSLSAFVVFLVIVYNFELYMLPVALLLIFLRSYFALPAQQPYSEGEIVPQSAGDDDESDEEKEKSKWLSTIDMSYLDMFDFVVFDTVELFEIICIGCNLEKRRLAEEERKSFKERLQAVQDVCLTVQNALGSVASHLESVKNTFNFTSPFLSWLLIFVLCVGTVVLYFVPIRWLVMAWGINKFTKKLRAPNAIPNNELLDFLSRVPDDQEKVMFTELPLEPTSPINMKKKKSQ